MILFRSRSLFTDDICISSTRKGFESAPPGREAMDNSSKTTTHSRMAISGTRSNLVSFSNSNLLSLNDHREDVRCGCLSRTEDGPVYGTDCEPLVLGEIIMQTEQIGIPSGTQDQGGPPFSSCLKSSLSPAEHCISGIGTLRDLHHSSYTHNRYINPSIHPACLMLHTLLFLSTSVLCVEKS